MSQQSFDVFLSHNHNEKPVVRELADRLEALGLKVWLDERELIPGRPWQDALEEVVETAKSAAVLVGNDGIGPWHHQELSACLSEFARRKLPVIPVFLPGAPAHFELPMFLRQLTFVDLRGGLTPAGLHQLRWAITGLKSDKSHAESGGSPSQPNEGDALVEDVVLLIHGIRSFGAWHQKVQRVIGSPKLRVVAPKYGWFPALRFIVPWDTSPRAMDRIYQEYLNAKSAFPNARISVIAHSFGTHLFTKLLQKFKSVRPWRVILCGSVVQQDFQWAGVADQVGPADVTDKARFIVNDCGNHDAWPVLAASAGWRYGNAGTDGFGSALVRDRFHQGNHTLFFDEAFIKKYWKPFIEEGRYVEGDANQGEGVPGWLRLLGRLRLRYLQILLPMLLGVGGYFAWSYYSTPTPDPIPVVMTMSTFGQFVSDITTKYASPVHDEYESKSFEWVGYVTDIETENKAYFVWPEPGEREGEEAHKIYAVFADSGGFIQTVSNGEKIRFAGRIQTIRKGGKAILDECQLLERGEHVKPE
jgi:hypothetical protein